MKRHFALLAGTALLAACASSGGPATAPIPAKAARADTDALVAQVRAAGAQGLELEVQPLRDPQVEDLRQQAEALEARREFKAASAALDQALQLVPGDPELLQWQAELALHRRAWKRAEALANQSFERGPRLGGLCRRNWATIGHARRQQGMSKAAEVAFRQGETCKVAPPVRM